MFCGVASRGELEWFNHSSCFHFCFAQEFWVPPREPLQCTATSAGGAGGASTVVGAATAKRAAKVKAEGATGSLGKPMPEKKYACTWYALPPQHEFVVRTLHACAFLSKSDFCVCSSNRREGCDYASRSSSHLRRHSRTHTHSRPYACTWEGCDYAASQHGFLVAHLRKHTVRGVPPVPRFFVCVLTKPAQTCSN